MEPRSGLLEGWLRLPVTLVLLFGLAIGLRASHLGESRLVAERQYRSAILARALYLETAADVPDWRKEVAAVSRERAGLLEPPVLEYLVSVVYRIVGGAHPWLGGLFSTVFWLVGGLALYRIARSLIPLDAAVIALAYYLLVPFGVVVSVSFLPEPLMLMLLLLSVLASLRYHERPTRRRLIAAGVTGGLATLAKPFCMFTVLAVFVALTLERERSWKCFLRADVLVFLGLSLPVGAAYYLYGIFVGGHLSTNLWAGFLPMLLFDPGHWSDWLTAARRAVGTAPLLVAVLGSALLPKGKPRAVLLGLVAGYALFGIAYTVPFVGAALYHVPLAIAVALAAGPPAALIVRRAVRSISPRIAWPLVLGTLTAMLLFVRQDVETKLATFRDFVNPEIAREIGEIVGHSTRTVHVACYYGLPLEYHAEVSGRFWPRPRMNEDLFRDDGEKGSARTLRWLLRTPTTREVAIRERFEALDFAPEYFLVTDLQRYERVHSDLKGFLENSCVLVAEGKSYLVYALHECTDWLNSAPSAT